MKIYGTSVLFFCDFLSLQFRRVKYEFTQEKRCQYVHAHGYLFVVAAQQVYEHITQVSQHYPV